MYFLSFAIYYKLEFTTEIHAPCTTMNCSFDYLMVRKDGLCLTQFITLVWETACVQLQQINGWHF